METLEEISNRTGVPVLILERMYVNAHINLVCALISYLLEEQDDERG